MKKTIALIAGLTLIATSAFATSIQSIDLEQSVNVAIMEHLNIDPGLDQILNMDEVNGIDHAVVIVDGYNKTASLAVSGSSCPANAKCIVNLTKTEKIELPVIKTELTMCGSKVITAEKNEMPVDGIRQTLVIVDHTQNICPTMMILMPTVVSFETEFINRFTGETVVTRSAMSGSALHKPTPNH